MGDSDRLKNYISDYLENSLDPSTHKKFEDALKISPPLHSITDKMTKLSNRLNNLNYYKCSDEFSVKLRERIHTSSDPFISRQTMVRYSFAASFVIILVIAIFTITNLSSESPDNASDFQGVAGSSANTPGPVKSPVSGNNPNATVKDPGELEVGTKTGPNAANDSTQAAQEKKNNEPPIKHVDKKE